MKDFPLRAWALTTAVALGAGLLTFSLARQTSGPHWPSFVGFALLIVLAEAVPVDLPHASYSVGFVVALAAVVALGPGLAAAASACGALDPTLRKRADWVGRLAFNAAQLTLSTAVAGLCYEIARGPIATLSGRDFPWILVPAAFATAAYFTTNVTLVAAMVALVKRVPLREVWHSNFRAASLSHFGFAGLGLLLAVLYVNIGWGAALFLLLPLMVARGAFHASARLQDAFDSTFRSLVTAIEAKDLYTRGHAERVSRLSEMVARESGLPERLVRQVRYAALMHDVGKLTVETRVLQKAGKLTPEEYEHMKIHPIRGAQIVSEIELLAGMIDGVRHHHERMDGGGYPDGLSGDELSLSARMIMVCDAFDSMTSTRSYRRAMPLEAALAELRRCQGTQFDSNMIDVLEKAIARRGWTPVPEAHEETRVGDASNRAAFA